MALRRDMSDAALSPHEIEEGKEHIPRHNPSIEEKARHTRKETHFAPRIQTQGRGWSRYAVSLLHI
jgi:hypothetical protein